MKKMALLVSLLLAHTAYGQVKKPNHKPSNIKPLYCSCCKYCLGTQIPDHNCARADICPKNGQWQYLRSDPECKNKPSCHCGPIG